jgi:hypothetical protein
MNLWANAQKTLINAGENTDVNFRYKFLTTSIPIVLTENDSIINTVNIDEELSKRGQGCCFYPL